MNPRSKAFVALFTFVTVLATDATAENEKLGDQQIASVQLFALPPLPIGTAMTIGRHYVKVYLSSPHDSGPAGTADLSSANIEILVLPSKKQLIGIDPAESRFIVGFGNRLIQIGLADDPDNRPVLGDTQVQVTFHLFHFKGGKSLNDLTGTGTIYDETNISKFRDDALKKLRESVASAKTTDEKDIFTSLNISVPSGGGSTQGNGDVSVNHTFYSSSVTSPSLFDQLNVGFHLNKGSQTNADPRHVEIGATLRKTVLLANKSQLRTIHDAIMGLPNGSTSLPSSLPTAGDTPEQVIEKLQKKVFRAIYLDNAVHFEGDMKSASIGNVSNVLYDSEVQITTINKGLVSKTGFFNFRLMPFGTELGYNITNSDDPQHSKTSLARIKSGAVLNAFYDVPGGIPRRMQLSVTAVERHLFENETAFDKSKNTTTLVTSGDKYWLDAGMKVFFLQTSAGFAGFKIGFQRGYLPPVYSFTKAFTFGIVFETADEDNSKTLILK